MANLRVAFIGMGIMGSPMTCNLLKAGFPVTVHTRTRAKAENVLSQGAVWTDTPAEAAKNCDIVITCLPDTPDVELALLGKSGVIETVKSGAICVDMSTISPAATKQMAKIFADKGVTLIDAPVSGGQIGAIEARLSIMMGGPKDACEKIRPVMEAMGKAITWCGPSGSGQVTKLVNQIMVIHTIMSISEGLAFAEKAGLDLQTTVNVTKAGAAGSHSLNVLGQKIVDGDLKPAFMVDLQMKDVRLIMEYASQLKQPLPGVALAKELLSVLQAQGRGRDGTQALIDVIRQLAAAKK